MSFTSLLYLPLLALVTVLYYLLPQRFRWILLLAASVAFYASWNSIYAIMLLAVGSFVYGSGLWMADRFKKDGRGAKAIFVCSLIVVLGLLVFFKYIDLLLGGAETLFALFGWPTSSFLFKLALPVGLSFYVFMAVAYLSDVYTKKCEAERHWGYLTLYLSFFATLLAGPIERADHLIPQLKSEHRFSWDQIAIGGRYLIIGYFKKLAIASVLSIYVDQVYGSLSTASGLAIILATAIYAFQIYADFSGYSDLAKGSAYFFGFDLVENFDNPYLATSSKDFWRRWHRSLSFFFRDYVYIPMGGSRCSTWRWAFNILVVFALSGLWHGADWNYVLWGLLFAIFQILGKLTLNWRNSFWAKCHLDTEKGFVKGLRIFNTFVLVDFAWLFFRSGNIQNLYAALTGLFTHYGAGYQPFAGISMPLWACFVVPLLALSSYFLELIKRPDQWSLMKTKPGLSEALLLGLEIVMAYGAIAAAVYCGSLGTQSSFAYFNF